MAGITDEGVVAVLPEEVIIAAAAAQPVVPEEIREPVVEDGADEIIGIQGCPLIHRSRAWIEVPAVHRGAGGIVGGTAAIGSGDHEASTGQGRHRVLELVVGGRGVDEELAAQDGRRAHGSTI